MIAPTKSRFVGLLISAVAMAALSMSAHSQGVLETPAPGSSQSGIGVISGWHCDAKLVEVFIDGGTAKLVAGSRTDRADTIPICGRADTGFSVLFNWNILDIHCFGCANHTVEAYADGRLFATSRFRVEHFDTEYLTGKNATYTLYNFPRIGSTTWLKWDESLQNFSVDLTSASTYIGPMATSYYGALLAGASNPTCYIVQPPAAIRHATFIVERTGERIALTAQFVGGSTCRMPSVPIEPYDHKNMDGYLTATFDSASTAACPELPNGLRIQANGSRFSGASLDVCRTVRAYAGSSLGTLP